MEGYQLQKLQTEVMLATTADKMLRSVSSIVFFHYADYADNIQQVILVDQDPKSRVYYLIKAVLQVRFLCKRP